jgi:hypothetical protein
MTGLITISSSTVNTQRMILGLFNGASKLYTLHNVEWYADWICEPEILRKEVVVAYLRQWWEERKPQIISVQTDIQTRYLLNRKQDC